MTNLFFTSFILFCFLFPVFPVEALAESSTKVQSLNESSLPVFDGKNSSVKAGTNLSKAASVKNLSSVSLKDKLGQLVIIGIPGTSIDPATRSLIEEYGVSSFILFSRNIKGPDMTRQLTSDLHLSVSNRTKLPALIAVDQEGGAVVRILTDPRIPSPLAVSSAGSVELAKALGRETGKILRSMGINVNLAPVLDLGIENRRSFLGTRSFGSSPEKVADFGSGFSIGLSEVGVMPVAKHFPGGGPELADPHKQEVVRRVSLEELRKHDLIPFARFAKLNFPSGVMMSHSRFPLIDASGRPALSSKTIVEALLREELQYGGLVMTDDLMMNTDANTSPSIDDRLVESKNALIAGADLLMFSWSAQSALKSLSYLHDEVRAGRIPISVINRAFNRITSIRAKIFNPLKDSSFLHPLADTSQMQRPSTSNSIYSSYANQKPRLISDELKDIVDKILQRNLAQADTSKISSIINSINMRVKYCLTTSDSRFANSFLEVLPQTHVRSIREPATPSACDLNLIAGSGKLIEIELSKLPETKLRQTLVIAYSPYDQKLNSKILGNIPIFSNFENAGSAIAIKISSEIKKAQLR